MVSSFFSTVNNIIIFFVYPLNVFSSDNSHLGRAWQEQAGPGYRYFLVFQDKDICMTGAYPMSEFLKILAEL